MTLHSTCRHVNAYSLFFPVFFASHHLLEKVVGNGYSAGVVDFHVGKVCGDWPDVMGRFQVSGFGASAYLSSKKPVMM